MYVKGLKALTVKMDGLSDNTINKILEKSCIKVQEDARDRCPKSSAYTGFGQDNLANSINHEVRDKEGVIGTNKFYAPFVHQGTGKYAVDGNGREGYWVFVKDGDPNYQSLNNGKVYTLEEAKQIMAMLRAQGLEAYYTNGQEAQPFLTDALDANEAEIVGYFKQAVKDSFK